MKQDLLQWGIPGPSIRVLHDCPPPYFKRSSLPESHALFQRVLPTLLAAPAAESPISNPFNPNSTPPPPNTPAEATPSPDFLARLAGAQGADGKSSKVGSKSKSDTPFTTNNINTEEGGAQRRGEGEQELSWREDRPAIVVSSTSWCARVT
eukprot:1177176-Prorocentrum_minimum.AAC.7